MNQSINFAPTPQSTTLTSENAFLKVCNGLLINQEIPLNRISLIVGRNIPPTTTVDIDLTPYELGQPPMTSRQQAVLEWIDGKLNICDLNSRNGTKVNNHKLKGITPNSPSAFMTLNIGDTIVFGNIEMEVISHE